ncbi:DUF1801 domain-containing protein [Gilvimarinus agarilyticus]|uniref:iron chaperone n=1 Tax=Gilvimarinus sp. 2_MG-2023 TaxID=3062666 RepID=UPI001C098A27|nr:DUF1801 domain-containing protein [Gilvimarinus sp. 2_MG-2023]MBU2885495.1 DUF1801 domain-containing protein [Gilvimarinus agarilyticus]MDO6570395.1 DUF1801 domain-containing protein [Gilvimarinus sp. 2_MG-2023]
MSSKKFSSVEDYLSSLDAKQGKTLREVINFIIESFPDLNCKLAWNVPQVYKGDDYVFGVSALKNHLALAPWSAEVIENFKEELERQGCVVKKNLFQVPNDWNIDKKLVSDLVVARKLELD